MVKPKISFKSENSELKDDTTYQKKFGINDEYKANKPSELTKTIRKEKNSKPMTRRTMFQVNTMRKNSCEQNLIQSEF